MSVTVTALAAKVTGSGIRTGATIQAENETAKVEIYAKPCSPFTFELTFTDYDGTTYKLNHRDSLPVSIDFNLENILHLGALAVWIKENGHIVSWKA